MLVKQYAADEDGWMMATFLWRNHQHMIDQSKKKALIEHIKQRQTANDIEILLPPDLYFDGYEAAHCAICANNTESISTAEFTARLQEIQERPDVSAVFVRFYDYSDAEASADCWIGSDLIYLVTRAGLDDVREWFSDFEVSDVWFEDNLAKFDGLPQVPDGFHLVAAWWD